MSKNAVVVLTRGYNDFRKYKFLIKRNISIAINLKDKKNTDILIFHEGNIILEHQNLIKRNTPLLNIIFINVKEKGDAFSNEKSKIPIYKPTQVYEIGYRHMCSFWFVDFWNYVEEYDKIIRVDEDCIIQFDIMETFELLNDKVACYGTWVKDDEYVVCGLRNFTLEFLKNNSIEIKNSITPEYIDTYVGNWNSNISGPYTNVVCLNLKLLRENEILKKYISKIKSSNCIYIYRWGDLPLWGEVLNYLYDSSEHLKTKKIKYTHDSNGINLF